MEREHEEGELHLQPTVYFSGQFRDVKKITWQTANYFGILKKWSLTRGSIVQLYVQK